MTTSRVPTLVLLSLATPVYADAIPSGRTDQQLAKPMDSISSETSPGPFEGFLALGVVADVLKASEPTAMNGMVPTSDTVFRIRPCVELRVADAVGACVGYSLATGRNQHPWIVDLTLISLAWHGIHLSVAAHLGGAPVEGGGAASLRLAIPLYAGWMPIKLPKARLRLVWTGGAIGAGIEWGIK